MKISYTPEYYGRISHITISPYRDGTFAVDIEENNGVHHEMYLDSENHIPIYGSMNEYPDETGDKLKYLDCDSPLVVDIIKILDDRKDDRDAEYVLKWLRHYKAYRSELG